MYPKNLLLSLLLMGSLGLDNPRLREVDGYCEWSAYGCTYFAYVSDTLCCAELWIDCGDGAVLIGEGRFGGCPT